MTISDKYVMMNLRYKNRKGDLTVWRLAKLPKGGDAYGTDSGFFGALRAFTYNQGNKEINRPTVLMLAVY
ncbi:MAG: hypothetical protein FWG44_03030 [Oscillospiraceae bacterium]|nr:hypothetical protein [Oscillospiraceae bacterium]